MYKLNFQTQSLPLAKEVKFYQGKLIRNDNLQLYSIINGQLYCFYFIKGKWQVLNIGNEYLDGTQKMYFSDILGTGQDILVTKHTEGIKFYQYNNSKLILINEDNDFHDLFNWSDPENIIEFGHIYHDKSLVGLLTKHNEFGLKFYCIMKSDLYSLPIWPLDTNSNILLNQSDLNQIKFYLTDFRNSGQDNIIVRTKNGLNVYEFNENNLLEPVISIDCCNDLYDLNDQIFFSNVTGSQYQDVLNFNSSGLYLYKYDNKISKYNFKNYHPLFSLEKGWTNKYTNTVTFLDINFDGKTEMIFTGPQSVGILSFDNIYNKWQSVLNNFELNVEERHGLVQYAVQQFTDTILLAYHPQRLQWAFIEEINTTSIEQQVPPNNYDNCNQDYDLDIISPVTIIDSPNDKEILYLRDQLEYSFIMNAVDTTTGTIKFMIPLVGLPNLTTKLNIFYDGSSTDVLGVGWSLPQNLIVLNHQSSVFPEDSIYYLVYQNVYQQLIFDSRNSTENIYKFKLKTTSAKMVSMEITYYKTKEQWEMKTEGLKRIYGNIGDVDSEAVMKESTWKNWRGMGSSSKDRIELAAGWYLSQISDDYGNTLYYHYLQINKVSSESGRPRNEIYLKQITDGTGNIIDLKYIQFSNDEIKSKLESKLYLRGYSINTSSITQEVDFLYTASNNKIFLAAIVQKNDYYPVLEFFYNDDNLIEKVTFSDRGSVEYDYRTLEELPSFPDKRQERVVLADENYKISYANKYTIISYKNNEGYLEMKIFDETMDKELHSSNSDLQLVKHNIKLHEIITNDNYFAIILWYDKNIDLYLYRWNESELLLSPKNYMFTDQAIIRSGKDFIAINDINSKPFLIEWNNDKKDFAIKTLGNNENGLLSTIVSFDRIILIYDDQDLFIWYKNSNNEWINKVIKHLPNLLSNIRDSLNRFHLGDDLYNYIYYQSRNRILQISNNLILLSTWGLNSTQFYSTINLFVLNHKYEIALESVKNILHENLGNLVKVYNDQGGTKYYCQYLQKESKLRLHIVSFEGPAKINFDNYEMEQTNEILNSRMPSREKQHYLREFRSFLDKQIAEFKKNVTEGLEKNVFPVDIEKYYGTLRAPIVISDNLKFNFTGSDWNVEKFEMRKKDALEMLGDSYVLYQVDSGSSIKLYRVDDDGKREQEHLLDLNVKHFNQTVNRYPMYLAYQEEDGLGNVVELTSSGSINELCSLPDGEKLSLFSGFKGIFTEVPLDPAGVALIYRSFDGMQRLRSSSVVTQSTLIYDDNMKRINGYDYDLTSATAFDDSVLCEQTTLIPGNNKESFGWIDETVQTNSSTKVIYNGQGEMVKTITKPLNAEDDKKSEDIPEDCTVFDKSNKFPVASFFPFNADSELVSYFGFEDYEVNSVGKNHKNNLKRWVFNDSNVKRNLFSFTGANYLQLHSGESLSATFNISDNNMTFIASTWIRPESEMPDVGSTTPYLKIITKNENGRNSVGFLSEVKLRSGGWYYLESIVNLYEARVNLNINQNDNRNSSLSLNRNINVTVVISPETNSTFHVDHVRFTPISCRFQANVYNQLTKSLKEEIQFNGLLKKFVYDKYLKKIATVNEYGQLVEFMTYTKVSSIGAIPQPFSQVIVQSAGGFYEDFSSFTNWNIKEFKNFKVSPSILVHTSQNADTLSLRQNAVHASSYGFRLMYSLKSENSKIKFNNNAFNVVGNEEGCYISVGSERLPAPMTGELTIIVEKNRIFIWVDGGLYVDSGNIDFNSKNDSSVVDIEIEGTVLFKDVMVFNNLKVSVTYFNSIREKIQEIKLEDEDNVIVTEYLYDLIGRQSITTKPMRIKREQGNELIAYYSSLVINNNPYSEDSVWKTGILKGKPIGDSVLGEYDYSEIKYNNDVLEKERTVGYPGKEFSTFGPFAKKFDTNCHILFIRNQYSPDEGYRCRTEYKSGGVLEILVSDYRDNIVARYVHVPGDQDLLSTYEYDSKNRLVMLLPPLYHEKVKTFFKLNPELYSTSMEEKGLQELLGTHLTYDNAGNILSKKTSDSGKIENIFDNDGMLKFVVYYKFQDDKKVDKILYFNYDNFFRIKNSGLLTTSVPVNRLLDTIHNNTQNYQEFYYNDADSEPTVRGRVQRTITFNEQVPFIEEFQIDDQEKTLKKRITIPVNEDEPLYVEINKVYEGEQLKEVVYPIEFQHKSLVLTYQYNKVGKIKSIGVPNNISLFYRFTYNPSGQIIREVHSPHSTYSFTRHYSYNSPGFLTSLKDKFLTEDISYTEPGYGGFGYGDGTITRTEFQATWHNSTINENISLNEQSFLNKNINAYESKLCYNKLKEAGYIDHSNHQQKIFYPQLELKVPIICSYGTNGRHISNVLGERGFPAHYGHIYDYGNHRELTKAKYFVGEERPTPLYPDVFAKDIPALNGNTTLSRNIWQILKDYRYLIEDLDKDNLSKAHAKAGKSFIRTSLAEDLTSINADYKIYKLNIVQLLARSYANSQTFSQSDFIDIFGKWKNNRNLSDNEKDDAIKMYKIFEKGNYLKDPISNEFLTALKEFADIIPDIVRILRIYFAKQLGEAEFDVESYGIDSNGNHKHYYTGFNRFEINYQNNTNRIKAVKYKSFSDSAPEQMFPMEHDDVGNVVQAMHKGIRRIEYDPVLNRASKIHLIDGRCITFAYDSQGERILKKVENKLGYIIKEVHYIRDELGRTLVERELTYVAVGKPPVLLTTAYIYGPRGLIGFIRRDEFYSVVCDHENSVRLVVKNGEVVAAYDYLPYGNTMREFASYPEAHISYRYTGQEWDEELALYNYHARFYDPTIGRFYQIDPKGQYFCPYKYAGNSPVSLIDPDGEFAFFLIGIIIGAIVGAYVGGASANNTWNLAKWDWKSSKTWLGIVGGGIIGAFMPVSIGGLISVGVGLGVAYLGAAAVNGTWDFTKWDYSSPQTWNAIFLGFATGSGSFKHVFNFFKSLTRVGKVIFIGSSIATGASFITMEGIANEWDLSKPEFWFGMAVSVLSATDLPMILQGAARFAARNGGRIKNFNKLNWKNKFSPFLKDKKKLISIASISTEVLIGLSPFLDGSEENDDFLQWDVNSVGTYQTLVSNFLSGDHISQPTKIIYKAYTSRNKTKFLEGVGNLPNNFTSMVPAMDEAIVSENRENSTFHHEIYEMYTRLIKRLQDSKESLKQHKIGDIPHAALLVEITDKYIISAVLSDGTLMLVMFFDLKKMRSPSYFLEEEFLNVSSYETADKEVPFNNDSTSNKYLVISIRETQNGIKQWNANQFVSVVENLKKTLAHFKGISTNEIDSIVSNFNNKIIEDGYLKDGKRAVITELSQLVDKVIGEQTADRRNYLHELNKILMEKMNKLKNSELREQHEKLTKEVQELKTRINYNENEVQDTEKIIIAESVKVIDSIWDQLEKFEEDLTILAPIGCAEPQVLSANSSVEEIMKGTFGSFNERISDIKFEDKYTLKNTLLPFELCDYCKIRSSFIKNIVTDPKWNEILNSNLLKIAIERKCSSNESLYFLSPYEAILKRNNSMDDYGNETDSKVKRSIHPNLRLVTENENDIHTTSATSGASTNIPLINNVLGWLKRTYTVYFSSAQNDLNYSNEKQFKNEETFSNSHYLFGKQWEDMIDVQSSLLLANVFVAKLFDTRVTSPANHYSVDYNEALAHAINITDRFEHEITHIATEFELIDQILNSMNFFEVQNLIMPKIMSNKLDEISGILNEYLETNYSTDLLDEYQIIKRKRFLQKMAEYINILMNDFFIEILNEKKDKVVTDSSEAYTQFDVNINSKPGISFECCNRDAQFLSSDIISSSRVNLLNVNKAV